MNGMIIATNLLSIFRATPQSENPLQGSSLGQGSVEGFSFLTCLLAVFNENGPAPGDLDISDGAERPPLVFPFQGTKPESEKSDRSGDMLDLTVTEASKSVVPMEFIQTPTNSEGGESPESQDAKGAPALRLGKQMTEVNRQIGEESPASSGLVGTDDEHGEHSMALFAERQGKNLTAAKKGALGQPQTPQKIFGGETPRAELDSKAGEGRTDTEAPAAERPHPQEISSRPAFVVPNRKTGEHQTSARETDPIARDAVSALPDPTLSKGRTPRDHRTPQPHLFGPETGEEGESVQQALERTAERPQARSRGFDGSMESRTALISRIQTQHDAGPKEGLRAFTPADEQTIHPAGVQSTEAAETPHVGHRPAPVFPGHGVMQQIVDHLNVRTLRFGQKDLKIQLHPEELGRVRMEIGLRDHQIVLKIDVENPMVKDLIENSLGQLREGLLDQGLKMERCFVTVGEHFQHPSGRNGENPAPSGYPGTPATTGESDEAQGQIGHPQPYGDSDLVNLFI